MTGSAIVGDGRLGSAGMLGLSLGLVVLVAAVGGVATARSVGPGSWYESLDRAPWNPPTWVFGPAWTVLYALIAVAAWLVAREGLDRPEVRAALGVYLAQLVLNLAWSWLFFGWRLPGWALVEIAVLLAAIVFTIVLFARVSATAAWLLVPYAAWVASAASLNAWVALRT
ncbi:MAG: TspO/MBR family protein [Gaiella sp.]